MADLIWRKQKGCKARKLYVRYHDAETGKVRWKSLAGSGITEITSEAAKEVLREYKAIEKKGRAKALLEGVRDKLNTPLPSFLDKYEKHAEAKYHSERQKRTLEFAKLALKLVREHADGLVGVRCTGDLQPEHFSGYTAFLRSRYTNLVTVESYLRGARAIWRWADLEGPYCRVPLSKVIALLTQTEKGARKTVGANPDDPLTPEQNKALLVQALALTDRHIANKFRSYKDKSEDEKRILRLTRGMFPFVILLMLTGLRRGEALKLQWDSVHEDDMALVVRAETSKNRRQRTVRFKETPLLAEYLRFLRKHSKGSKYVLRSLDPQADGSKPMEVPQVALRTLKRRLDFRFRPKTLRMNWVTYSVSAPWCTGRDAVARLAGHSAEIAQRHYDQMEKLGLQNSEATTLCELMGVKEPLENLLYEAAMADLEPVNA